MSGNHVLILPCTFSIEMDLNPVHDALLLIPSFFHMQASGSRSHGGGVRNMQIFIDDCDSLLLYCAVNKAKIQNSGQESSSAAARSISREQNNICRA